MPLRSGQKPKADNYAKFYSRSHGDVIRAYHEAGSVGVEPALPPFRLLAG